jgi:hypothetical protein
MEKKLLMQLLKDYQAYMNAHYVQDDVKDYAYLEKVADAILNLNKAFVSGRSEQFVCRDCEKPTKEYRNNLCEPCHKWHTDS